MQKKKLVVFDIDDTLTKSEDQHQTAYVNTMRHFGIHDIDQNWKNYVHHTDSYILKENYERNLPQKFDFSFILKFENKMTLEIQKLAKTTEIKGAKKAVRYFMDHTDYAVCFATGSLLEPACLKLAQAGIPFVPELVVGSNNVFEREAIVKRAIESAKSFYKVDIFEQIISVGDGIWDLKTARNLNIHFIGILEKNLEDFRKEGLTVHIKDWQDFEVQNIETQLGIK
ncbi:HAD family hydrolase [Flavobacteriaceae bacterium S356]|uniref:HAD family hydrolase n=1 Tax=Asprobacillus argus TaxID=3076534 RepID=A0ABU3LF46_9FLAO|nr:HAD family hydrolase [Flavobacteriaceae bacterium S356]